MLRMPPEYLFWGFLAWSFDMQYSLMCFQPMRSSLGAVWCLSGGGRVIRDSDWEAIPGALFRSVLSPLTILGRSRATAAICAVGHRCVPKSTLIEWDMITRAVYPVESIGTPYDVLARE
ncbi:hypothetical protein K439DRAFT_1637780 [Ramaria rubella]|nr:hypothetical protein K439DRAFT_1637780 [Ramaria rubella]